MPMADEPASPSHSEQGLGIRQGPERRNGDRRHADRGTTDRRQRDRRRKRLRNLALTALTFALPHSFRHNGLSQPQPRVSVAVNSFDPIPATHAYDRFIQEAAAKHSLDPALIRAVIHTESAFNPLAVSRVGAMGLMQLMPGVADKLGVDNPFDPRQNIMGGS